MYFKKLRIFTPVLPALVFLLFACAENKLVTYMVVQTGTGQDSAAKKRGQIRLSEPPLLLTMVAPEADELDELAEDLKLSGVSKYHRLPPLTYLRFDFENKTAIPWQLNLNAVYFSAGDRSFRVVKSAEYENRFTSVAYEHFRYDAMYASYITRRNNTAARDSFWFDKKAPHEIVEVKPGESGFQVLPFEFIPPGVENMTLHISTDGRSVQMLPVKLVTERGS